MKLRAVTAVAMLAGALGGCAPPTELPQCNCPLETTFDPPGCAPLCPMVANNPPGPDGGQLVEWAIHRWCSAAEQARGCHASPPTTYGGGPLEPPELAA